MMRMTVRNYWFSVEFQRSFLLVIMMYDLSCHERKGKALFHLGCQTLKTCAIKEVDFATVYLFCSMERSKSKKIKSSKRSMSGWITYRSSVINLWINIFRKSRVVISLNTFSFSVEWNSKPPFNFNLPFKQLYLWDRLTISENTYTNNIKFSSCISWNQRQVLCPFVKCINSCSLDN